MSWLTPAELRRRGLEPLAEALEELETDDELAELAEELEEEELEELEELENEREADENFEQPADAHFEWPTEREPMGWWTFHGHPEEELEP